MCKIEKNQKKAIALALQMEGEVWAAYEYLDGKHGPRDLTTVIVCFRSYAKSFRVTSAGDLKFEKSLSRMNSDGFNNLKRLFKLPFGNLCKLEYCNC